MLEKFVEESVTRGLISEDDLSRSRCLLEKRYGHNLFQILVEGINLNSSHKIINIMRSLPELEHLAERLQHDMSLCMIEY